jgi:hypothetical protein
LWPGTMRVLSTLGEGTAQAHEQLFLLVTLSSLPPCHKDLPSGCIWLCTPSQCTGQTHQPLSVLILHPSHPGRHVPLPLDGQLGPQHSSMSPTKIQASGEDAPLPQTKNLPVCLHSFPFPRSRPSYSSDLISLTLNPTVSSLFLAQTVHTGPRDFALALPLPCQRSPGRSPEGKTGQLPSSERSHSQACAHAQLEPSDRVATPPEVLLALTL